MENSSIRERITIVCTHTHLRKTIGDLIETAAKT